MNCRLCIQVGRGYILLMVRSIVQKALYLAHILVASQVGVLYGPWSHYVRSLAYILFFDTVTRCPAGRFLMHAL